MFSFSIRQGQSKLNQRIDTEITVSLPKNLKGFVTSIFRGDEINEFNSE